MQFKYADYAFKYALMGAHLSVDLQWLLVVMSLKQLTCRIWKNWSLAIVIHRFASDYFLVLRMLNTVISHNCSNKGYQQVTAKSELISQSADL